jgi:Domain of unknown function (DUF4430)
VTVRIPLRWCVLAALVLAALALGGCGLAVGPAPSAVQLLVTSEFGGRLVRRSGALHASEGETVERLLSGSYPVRTSSSDSHVASIDGLSATAAQPGQPEREWSYYVNGVQVDKPPAKRGVNPGDHVWWDLHAASHTAVTPALVGAYPEPFLNGVEGRRLPIRVECASVSQSACTTVTESLRRAGVPAAVAGIGSGGAPETLRVMVGPWVYLESDLEAQSIARGPQASGVYVRLPANGRKLELLDQQGETVRTLGAGAGGRHHGLQGSARMGDHRHGHDRRGARGSLARPRLAGGPLRRGLPGWHGDRAAAARSRCALN